MDDSSVPVSDRQADAKEIAAKKMYRRAVNYCKRYIGRESDSITGKEFLLIKRILKLILKFSRNYPDNIERDFLIDRIPRPSTRTTTVVPSKKEKPADGPGTSRKLIPETSKPSAPPKGKLSTETSQTSASTKTEGRGLSKSARRIARKKASKKTDKTQQPPVYPPSAELPKPRAKAVTIGQLLVDEQKVVSAMEVPVSSGHTSAAVANPGAKSRPQPTALKIMRSSEEQQPAAKRPTQSSVVKSSASFASVVASKEKPAKSR
ncbi:uncharacterized protein LOC133323324 [Musca vetustissima]|uniref:uncharacterized protein LOC133323324 n=1 Tax=Musca vetustissima TaxID=27455 RepID=UPI002AB79432|nr:uncharacterized protein LOC133323324 [Musca vetustissima]